MSGVAVATATLAENLADTNNEVFVFTPGSKFRTVKNKGENYTIEHLRSIGNPFRQGYRITFITQKEIDRLVRKIKPDLIHLQDPVSIGNLLLNAGTKLHIPVIATNHFSLEYALSYLKNLKPFLPAARYGLIKYLVNFYDKCNQILTPTETIAKQIRSWGVKTKVLAASNGIFFHRFAHQLSKKKIDQFKRKFHLPNNPLVLYLGRIDKDKSIDVLIKAIPEVVKKSPAHFILAGSGDLLVEMENLVDELGVRNKVTFLGRVEHESEDLVAAYQSASVFAIPSTIETQSIVTLEAMSASLPVVAANANALPEIVQNEENGYLFEPGDYQGLAEKLVKIVNDKILGKKMGQKSLIIASHHEMKLAFNKMARIYREVIDSNKKLRR